MKKFTPALLALSLLTALPALANQNATIAPVSGRYRQS
ncbi:hypothetical protein C7330_0424 [Pectobacterium versatile]|nr:hypothetical protein C7330_0424 [Pectobacterium versatile]